MDALITRFQRCAKRSAGAAVVKCHIYVTHHFEVINKLLINQSNIILLIYHPETKLTPDMCYG